MEQLESLIWGGVGRRVDYLIPPEIFPHVVLSHHRIRPIYPYHRPGFQIGFHMDHRSRRKSDVNYA